MQCKHNTGGRLEARPSPGACTLPEWPLLLAQLQRAQLGVKGILLQQPGEKLALLRSHLGCRNTTAQHSTAQHRTNVE